MQLGFTYNVRSATGPGSPSLGLAGDAEEEFDSPETIEAIAHALRSSGHEVELLGDGEPLLRRLVDGRRPELIFNIAEGTGVARSREARVPAVLEMLGIPYTGSDPLTLAVALDKPLAKTIVAAAGVAVPRGVVIEGSGFRVQGSAEQAVAPAGRPGLEPSRGRVSPRRACESRRDSSTWSDLESVDLPLIAKPAFEGSSKGILGQSIIEDRDALRPSVERLLEAYQQPVLVEEFIDGDELTVGVLGNSPPRILGVMRVVPRSKERHFVYGLDVKRDWRNQVCYECPAPLTPSDTTAVEQAALAVYQALGCRDVARIDFRLRRGLPYFIEANPLPGLTPNSSDIVLMAQALDIEYRELLQRILAAAAERYGMNDQ